MRAPAAAAGGTGGMNAIDRAGKLAEQLFEGKADRLQPADHHVVMAGPAGKVGRKPHRLAQAPPCPVAHDGVADLLRQGEAEADGLGPGAG